MAVFGLLYINCLFCVYLCPRAHSKPEIFSAFTGNGVLFVAGAVGGFLVDVP